MRRYVIYILIFVLALTGLLYVQSTVPKPLDWTPTFSKEDKIPLGSYLLFESLHRIFPEKKIEAIEIPLYSFLKQDDYENTNLIILSHRFMPDKSELEKILEYAARGNNVFIASTEYPEKLTDTLNFSYDYNISIDFDSEGPRDSLKILLTKTHREVLLKAGWSSINFFELDSANAILLGEDENENANFIGIPVGNGMLYLHSIPYLFSNYFVVNENKNEYVFSALSHLPVRNTFWYDQSEALAGQDSEMKFILSQPALRSGYYLLLISLLLYIIFEGKRRQRVIPVIEPLRNSSVEFATTVGELYYNQADNKLLAEKKIRHFQEYCRTKFFVNAELEDIERFGKTLSVKAGIPLEEAKSLLRLITKIHIAPEVDNATLLALNKKIDRIYTKI